MTTIAIRDGVVAFDSRLTMNDIICPDINPKALVSKNHPYIFAGAGSTGALNTIFSAFEVMKHLPWEIPGWNPNQFNLEHVSIYAVRKDGAVFTLESGGCYQVTGPFQATGSGMQAALAAMHMGADACKAVEIAIAVDSSSGGAINRLSVADIPEPKRKSAKRKRRR